MKNIILTFGLMFIALLSFSQEGGAIETSVGINVKSVSLLDYKGKISELSDTTLILADTGQLTYAIDSAKFYLYDGTSWSLFETGVDSIYLFTQYDWDTTFANSFDIETDSFTTAGKWIMGDIMEYDRSNTFTGLQIPDYQTVVNISDTSGKWFDTPTGDNIYFPDSTGIGTDSPTEMLDVDGNVKIRDSLIYHKFKNFQWMSWGDSFSTFGSKYSDATDSIMGWNAAILRGVAGDISEEIVDRFSDSLTANANLLDGIDILTFQGGVNDCATSYPIGSEGSTTGEASYAGQVKRFIELALTRDSTMTIYIILPSAANTVTVPWNGTNAVGDYLKDYVAMGSQIARLYGIGVIDWFGFSGFNEHTLDFYTDDMIHPNPRGAIQLALVCEKAFKSIPSSGNLYSPPTDGSWETASTGDVLIDGNNFQMKNTAVSLNAANTFNIHIGRFAGNGRAATATAGFNTYIGGTNAGSTGTGRYNVGISSYALRNTSGDRNVAIGYQAMAGVSGASGAYNLALGYNAMFSNTTGSQNTSIGYLSGQANTTGSNNLYLGSSSGAANTTGVGNVFLGSAAGIKNLTGSLNIFIGNSSGKFELGGNRLYIDPSSTTSPLIYGDFDTDSLFVNGDFTPMGAILPSKYSINTYLGTRVSDSLAYFLYNLTSVFSVTDSVEVMAGAYGIHPTILNKIKTIYNGVTTDTTYIEMFYETIPLTEQYGFLYIREGIIAPSIRLQGDVTADTLRINGDLKVGGEFTNDNSFGEMSDPADVISTATEVYYTFTNWTSGEFNEAVLDADSTILINQAGTYLINFSMSFIHSANSTTVHICAFNSTDNTEFTNIETEMFARTGGDTFLVSGTGIAVLAASDKISIRGKADKTGNLTINHGNLNIIRIK